jgi:hypothetical protein
MPIEANGRALSLGSGSRLRKQVFQEPDKGTEKTIEVLWSRVCHDWGVSRVVQTEG